MLRWTHVRTSTRLAAEADERDRGAPGHARSVSSEIPFRRSQTLRAAVIRKPSKRGVLTRFRHRLRRAERLAASSGTHRRLARACCVIGPTSHVVSVFQGRPPLEGCSCGVSSAPMSTTRSTTPDSRHDRRPDVPFVLSGEEEYGAALNADHSGLRKIDKWLISLTSILRTPRIERALAPLS